MTTPQKETFTNELGNAIELSVSEKDIDGTEGVFIVIAGPTSDTTLHITKREAEKLNEQLKEVLKS